MKIDRNSRTPQFLPLQNSNCDNPLSSTCHNSRKWNFYFNYKHSSFQWFDLNELKIKFVYCRTNKWFFAPFSKRIFQFEMTVNKIHTIKIFILKFFVNLKRK